MSRTRGAGSVDLECLRGAALLGVGVGVVLVLLWAATFPGWPLAAGVIMSMLVLAGLLACTGPAPVPAARRLRPAGLVAGLAVAVVGAVLVEISAGSALLARFEREQPAFEAVVQQAGAPPTVDGGWAPFPGTCPARIGGYGIGECRAFDGGFLLVQRRGALGGEAGFAYAPDGLPTGESSAELSADRFGHLVGAWYAWR